MLVKNLIIILFLSILSFSHDNTSDKEKAYFYFYKGKSARQEGNYLKAINNYKKAIKSEPSNNQYIMALIQAYLETGKFQSAQKKLNIYKGTFSDSEDAFMWNFISGLNLACNSEHKKAFLKFSEAEKLICNLKTIDSTIISHLYNNLGCEKILNQPTEWSPHVEDHPHLTINFDVFPKVWPYFTTALRYNPQNFVVIENMNFINQFCNCFDEMQKSITDHTIVIDNIVQREKQPVKEKNNKLPSFGIKFLPDKIWQIINVLNDYDEIVFVLDISGSMDTEIEIKDKTPTRFEVMVDLAKYLAASLKSDVSLGGISVGSDCDAAPVLNYKPGVIAREFLISEINSLEVDGYTPLNNILNYSEYLFSDTAQQKAILLCTDGLNSCGEGNTCEIAETLHAKGINIYILSFLVEQSNQEEYSVFDCMANISDGEIFEIESEKGIVNKTIDFEPPLYSLLLPTANIDTSYCLKTIRLKCTLPCNPTMH